MPGRSKEADLTSPFEGPGTGDGMGLASCCNRGVSCPSLGQANPVLRPQIENPPPDTLPNRGPGPRMAQSDSSRRTFCLLQRRSSKSVPTRPQRSSGRQFPRNSTGTMRCEALEPAVRSPGRELGSSLMGGGRESVTGGESNSGCQRSLLDGGLDKPLPRSPPPLGALSAEAGQRFRMGG